MDRLQLQPYPSVCLSLNVYPMGKGKSGERRRFCPLPYAVAHNRLGSLLLWLQGYETLYLYLFSKLKVLQSFLDGFLKNLSFKIASSGWAGIGQAGGQKICPLK